MRAYLSFHLEKKVDSLFTAARNSIDCFSFLHGFVSRNYGFYEDVFLFIVYYVNIWDKEAGFIQIWIKVFVLDIWHIYHVWVED